MAIASTDLKAFGAANMVDADTGTVGGAIDETHKVEFTQFASAAIPYAESDNAGDTMNMTIEGRNAAGEIISETKALNGTTPVGFTTMGSAERILKVTLASAASGTVVVKEGSGGTTRITIEAGITDVTAFFRKSASAGTQQVRYEKFFWLNDHATLSLTSAQVTLTADPASRIRIALEDAVDDTGTSTNRATEPSGIGSWTDDSSAINVPGGSLAAQERIGVWAEQTLPADDPPNKSTFTTQLSGQSA